MIHSLRPSKCYDVRGIKQSATQGILLSAWPFSIVQHKSKGIGVFFYGYLDENYKDCSFL